MAQAIDRLKGTVRWFNGRRGFGFITPEDGGEDLFVHHSSIKAAGFRCLLEGEFVEFSVDVGDDGRTRAADVTGPGGASVQCSSYGSVGQRGPCYSCGEVGHLARNCCLRNGGRGGVGPCYSCGEMGHLARDCPATCALFDSPYPMPETLTNEEDEVEEDKVEDDEVENDEVEEDEVEEDEVEEDVEELPAGEQRNWAELPRDVLSVIFKKIAAIEIIRSAQFVCRPWRHLSHEAELWRCIDMTGHVDLFNEIDMNTLAIEAVDRSSGRLEEFHGEYVGNNELMDFMADRATLLRCLCLTSACMYDDALVQALKKFPLLEELELTLCSFSDEVVELAGQACPHLKTFRLNQHPYIVHDDSESDSELNPDSEALAIAKHMQQLRYLQLFGNMLTNDGLTAILDNCPYLQHLDIRRCLYVNPDENLKKKLARIKVLRLPNDSTADCPFDRTISESDYGDPTIPDPDYGDPCRSDSEYDFEYGDYGYYDFDEYPDVDYDGFLGDGFLRDVFWGDFIL